MEDLVFFPEDEDAFMGALPEVEGGDVLIGVMPDEPATVYIIGNAGKDEGKDFTESEDEECAVRLEDAEALGDPAVGPGEVGVHGLFVAGVAEVFADVVWGVGKDDLDGFIWEFREDVKCVPM